MYTNNKSYPECILKTDRMIKFLNIISSKLPCEVKIVTNIEKEIENWDAVCIVDKYEGLSCLSTLLNVNRKVNDAFENTVCGIKI